MNKNTAVARIPDLRGNFFDPNFSSSVSYYPAEAPSAKRYADVHALLTHMQPTQPVEVFRPHVVTRLARWFQQHFPGDVMYSVKSNPQLRVLSCLYAAGIRHFDTASISEVALIHRHFPDAEQFFMHPVKPREAIAQAYFHYGVRHFSLDSHAELQKILEVTGRADDLNLYVRLAIPNETAAYALTGKFGVALEEAISLLQATRKVANKLGICFHVGSQAMDPAAYARTIGYVRDLMQACDVRLDALDVGGGFPSAYPGLIPPPMIDYMAAIKEALRNFPGAAECRILCEPGRALVAESGSILARVELRKNAMLYLNDGIYGSLFDAGTPAFPFPVKAHRVTGKAFAEDTQAFGFFGPTCDSMDVMKGPFHLPADIDEGDWIEMGQLGAYGSAMRTNFNGFYSDVTAEVEDAPLMSVLF